MSDTYHPLAAGVANVPGLNTGLRIASVGGRLALLSASRGSSNGNGGQRGDGDGEDLHACGLLREAAVLGVWLCWRLGK